MAEILERSQAGTLKSGDTEAPQALHRANRDTKVLSLPPPASLHLLSHLVAPVHFVSLSLCFYVQEGVIE